MIPPAYVRFPPSSRHVLVPAGPPSAAALGITLYTASRPRALLAQRVIWLVTRLGGLRLLPGEREGWTPPFGDDVLAELHAQWCGAIGGSVEGLAVYNRPQQHRPAVALLVCAGRRSLLIRVRPAADGLGIEPRIAERAGELGIDAFSVPRLRASGSVGEWDWVGYEAMGTRPHAPVTSAAAEVFTQASALVEAVLPRPASTPTQWRGAHGDLTPWNFRRAGRTPWIVDWEDARYAPEGADETYFTVTSAAIRRRPDARALARISRYGEASEYWRAELAGRPFEGRDERLIERMSTFLDDAHPRAGG